MKIGIDARLYGTKHGGIGRYIFELVEKLQLLDHKNSYVLFLQRSNYDECQIKNDNFRKVIADFKAYSLGENLFFPLVIGKEHLDFMHFPHFNVPYFYFGKYLVTIHDLIISHHPDSRATTLPPLVYKIKLLLYNLVVKSAAKRAERIIAVSEFTKADISRLLGVAEEKISVIYEGFALPAARDADCQKLLQQQGIGDNFLLYVGSAYPHKNLEKLIQAFVLISQQDASLQLVLVGKINFFYERLKTYVSENYPLAKEKIVFMGYLSDEDLSCLYQNAKLYVFPSLIEGFGLPPLEAQAYDLPVVSSNFSCLPEVLGESVIYFNPENVQEMAEKISLALNDSALRQTLAEKGKQNIQRFSWKRMVEEILGIYNSFND